MTKKEFRQKWVEALRSGKYKQGQGALYRKTKDVYCCLGVACKIYNEYFPNDPVKLTENHHGFTEFDGMTGIMPPQVRTALGLTYNNGYHQCQDGRMRSLIIINDLDQLSFAQIADIIESEPIGLLVDAND